MPGSATIGNLAVNLTLETAAFQAGTTIAEKRMSALGDSFGKVGKRMTQAGTIMTASITLPLIAFGAKAAQAASDAQEMQSAFDVTFGSMSKSVAAWAEKTGDAMGRSTQEMQRGALAFQELFGKALDPAKSAQMSKTFAVLTQDLASFKNLSNEVAQQKLLSGLAGEAEPLRAVGVFLSAAKVEAAALAMGLGDVNGKLTEEEKIIARAAVIQKELAKASGDVMRTSEGAANKTKQAAAAYEELSVAIGTRLLPLKVKLAEIAIKVLDAFSKLSPEAQNFALGAVAIVAALGPMMMVLGPIIIGVGQLLPLIVKLGPAFTTLRVVMMAALGNPVILGAAVVIGGIYLAWKNWDKISAIVQRVYTAVKTWIVDKLGAIWEGVKAKIASVTGAFAKMYDAVVGNSYVPDMVDEIGAHMGRLPEVMVAPALDAAEQVGTAFDELTQKSPFQAWADSMPQTAAQVSTALQDIAFRGFDSVADAITGVIMGTQSLAEAFSGIAKQIIADIIQMTLKMLIFRAVSAAFGGGGGGAGLSSGSWGALYGGDIPQFAQGGSGTFGGFGGVDRNVLSLNGSPIARVSKGENFSVSPAANNNAPVELHVSFAPSPEFMPIVENVSARQIGRVAPMIVKTAVAATMRISRRPKLMGRG